MSSDLRNALIEYDNNMTNVWSPLSVTYINNLQKLMILCNHDYHHILILKSVLETKYFFSTVWKEQC